MRVAFTEDPALALSASREFLSAEPVKHNLMLTLLSERVAHPEPGRYWFADGIVGLQSPLNFPAVIVGYQSNAIEALVDAISDANVELPGVIGEAAAAARFAGHWSERRKSAAIPIQGQRIYELQQPTALQARGHMRRATSSDRSHLIDWMRRFNAEADQHDFDVEPLVDRRAFYVWCDDDVVAMVAHTDPLDGVVRVQYVYTPPEQRRRGYAGACVAQLSHQLHRAQLRCMLYTDLANPTSNSIYRRIGYRAVQEGLRYRFDKQA